MDMVDVLVIGAGPAGLNAALYAARKELTVKVVTTDIGGQMLLTNEIEIIWGFRLFPALNWQTKWKPM